MSEIRKIKQLYFNAEDFFNNKHYDLALELYDEFLKFNPYNLKALYKKALILSIKEEYSKSLDLLNHILDINYCIEVLFLKGQIYFKLGEYIKAMNQYRLANEVDYFNELNYYNSK